MAEPKPRGDRVVVKIFEDAEAHAGIVIPSGVQPYPSRGVVMYVGPGFRKPDGEYLSLDICVGDEVLFFHQQGIEVMLGDERLCLLRDEEILLVVEPALQTVGP